MSYIDAAIIDDGKMVQVWERDDNDNLVTKKYDAEYYCYIADEKGTQKTLFVDEFSRASRKTFTNQWDMREFVTEHLNQERPLPLFESDISPDLKVLSDFYYKAPIPNMHVTFLDIENDADLENRDWPTIDDPYGDITSVAFYHQWKKEFVLITTPPPGYDGELFTAEELGCDRVVYTKSEDELLHLLILEVKDSDIISGWNCDRYDIPYILGSIRKHVGDDALTALCRDNIPAKKRLIKSKFGGDDDLVYKLVGRVNIDYMDLYKKYTFAQLPSYSLENVADYELGYGKLNYTGTLPELYRADYKKFLKYNIHDVVLLRDIDDKMSFMDIVNRYGHDCCCRMHDVMGTVVGLDQALITFAHHELGQVVPDRGVDVGLPEYISTVAEAGGSTEKYIGATVYDLDTFDETGAVTSTKKGLHKNIASIDVTSEYPKAMISNNISIETVTAFADRKNGDIIWASPMSYDRATIDEKQEAANFNNMINKRPNDFVLKRTYIKREAERLDDWSRVEKQESYCWGARNDVVGIVPQILMRWFDDRLRFKALLKEQKELAQSLIVDGSVPKDQQEQYEYHIGRQEHFDRLQHITKIKLNSLYGAVGNSGSHFFNLAAAEATTLCGRGILNVMTENVAEILDNTRDIRTPSIIYQDTDSVAADTVITTNRGDMSIEDLYHEGDRKWSDGEKEYSHNPTIDVLTFDPPSDTEFLSPYNYVYRHKTSKKKWEITSDDGAVIVVTDDHSCMVERGGELISLRPSEMVITDLLIAVDKSEYALCSIRQTSAIKRTATKSIRCIGTFDDEYVYDIGVDNDTPYFFGNNILVHNSCYFKLPDEITEPDDLVIYADYVAETANSKFYDYMVETHNCKDWQAKEIRADREVVADRALFTDKKRYAMHLIDLDGYPVDKLKVMGLDVIKSTTPIKVKAFLNELLSRLLKEGHTEDQLSQFILDFRDELNSEFTPLDFGEPKGVKNIDDYKNRLYIRKLYDKSKIKHNVFAEPLTKKEKTELKNAEKDADRWKKITKGKSVMVPGHVMASINWNMIIQEIGDKTLRKINSGTKIRTFYLKTNQWKIKSIAIPSDLDEFPQWFLDLPFDMPRIEQNLIDKKVESLYNSMSWRIPTTATKELNNVFSF